MAKLRIHHTIPRDPANTDFLSWILYIKVYNVMQKQINRIEDAIRKIEELAKSGKNYVDNDNIISIRMPANIHDN